MQKTSMSALCLFAGLTATASLLPAQRVMERLGRGIVAIRQADGKVYVGWRLLASDPVNAAFDLYRSTGGAAPVKLTSAPLTATTDYVDAAPDLTKSNAYSIRETTAGEASSAPFILAANAPARQYLSIPLQRPPDGSNIGGTYSYSANDASSADLDGDGEYEIILKWEPSASLRPPQTGFTGDLLIDAYKLDGTRLWRINGGKNVRVGAAYISFMVYDLDGNGKAELVMRTADGTVDGTGAVLGDPDADWRNMDSASPIYGKVLTGPEYITVFDGLSGKALASKPFIPTRDPIGGWGGTGGNGGNDSTGNRSDHFSACVAYLDGRLPSIVWVRGWYGRSVLAAWDWRGGELTSRWVFDSARPGLAAYSGMGNHSVTVADFDNDGKDEVNIGAMCVDDNGTGLYTTGLRHGDALHAGDFNPARPGLEVFGAHENEGSTVALQTPGTALYDGRTGQLLWGNNPGVDVGRAMAADIDPNFPGAECWGAPGGTRRADTGAAIYPQTPGSVNFAVWWDADLLRELEDGTSITKWNWQTKQTETLFSAAGAESNNGTKSTPCLTADLLGDWREEVIWRSADSTELGIFTTTIPAENRLVTLMHDPQYRLAVAWQNVAYNQPPHPSFQIGPGMPPPPRPNIELAPIGGPAAAAYPLQLGTSASR